MVSIHVYRWAVKNSGANDGVEQAVLLNLADHAHDDGRDAFPSVSTIARETKFSEDSVRRAVARLLKRECIRHDGWKGPHGRRTKNYTVLVPWTPGAQPGGSAARGVAPGAPPLAESQATPSAEQAEPPGNNHRSVGTARERAPEPPSLAPVLQQLEQAFAYGVDRGRLHINRSDIAEVLRRHPASIERHVEAAAYAVARAFEPPTEGKVKLYAETLIATDLRNRPEGQLTFDGGDAR